jgi:hypothetical protein
MSTQKAITSLFLTTVTPGEETITNQGMGKCCLLSKSAEVRIHILPYLMKWHRRNQMIRF